MVNHRGRDAVSSNIMDCILKKGITVCTFSYKDLDMYHSCSILQLYGYR